MLFCFFWGGSCDVCVSISWVAWQLPETFALFKRLAVQKLGLDDEHQEDRQRVLNASNVHELQQLIGHKYFL